jgi:hypothetical protein
MREIFLMIAIAEYDDDGDNGFYLLNEFFWDLNILCDVQNYNSKAVKRSKWIFVGLRNWGWGYGTI